MIRELPGFVVAGVVKKKLLMALFFVVAIQNLVAVINDNVHARLRAGKNGALNMDCGVFEFIEHGMR